VVNHERVYRLMREDNLLCLRKRKFVVTTDSHHDLPVYPNLAGAMSLTGRDHLWVADITYIRLLRGFVYLAVILDAFSRRVIGWALDRTLEDELTLQALHMALERRKPAAGLVHHSDRSVQYASRDYTALLLQPRIAISMSRKGNPYDNAVAESFMKTRNTRKCTGKTIGTWRKRALRSSVFSNRRTTKSDCIPLWAICLRWNLRNRSRRFRAPPRDCRPTFRPFWRREYEFFEAWGNLSPDEWFEEFAGAASGRLPPASSLR
jgi:transposase InsO family protein